MDMSTALAADLARLTEALDDPGVVDLPALLGRCHDALLAAVPSGLGLSMTFPAGPAGVTVSTLPAAGTAIRSSLRVRMTPWADVDPGSDVVFYAAIRRGAGGPGRRPRVGVGAARRRCAHRP